MRAVANPRYGPPQNLQRRQVPRPEIAEDQVLVRVRTVTELAPGDEVFGSCSATFAELTVGRERNLVAKPVNLELEHAAAIPGAGVTALQAVRDHGAVQPGQDVLVNGAAGGVGTYALQIAKAHGARVTGV